MELDSEIMSAYTVVFDGLQRLGPGDSATTRELVERLRTDLPSASRVADFGCGVGASALVLAQCLPESRVLALDSHAPFIARLESEARDRGLEERISAVVGDMADPPPLDGVAGEFDLIWSESAIYSIGRSSAFTNWRALLKPDGWLVFTDIVWQRDPTERSGKATSFWAGEYPCITTATGVVNELAAAGFEAWAPIMSPREAWSNYYEPLRERLRQLSRQQGRSQPLVDVLAEFERELNAYDCAGDEVALAFFVSRRGPISK